MRTLHLVLIGKWYDMIASGEKTEEYRAITPYWCNKLIYKFGVKYWNGIFDNDHSITFFERIHDEITKLHTKHSYKYE